jgi:hypothetical protein
MNAKFGFIDTTLGTRAFGIADTGATPQGCSARAALQRLGCRVIGTATAKNDIFAITINEATIGVVGIDLERGAWPRHLESYGR